MFNAWIMSFAWFINIFYTMLDLWKHRSSTAKKNENQKFPIAKTPNVSPGLLVKSNPIALSLVRHVPRLAARRVGRLTLQLGTLVVSLENHCKMMVFLKCLSDKVAELSHRIHVCYMVTFTINIPQMLAYIPYMDPMGILLSSRGKRRTDMKLVRLVRNHMESSTKSMSRCIAKSFRPPVRLSGLPKRRDRKGNHLRFPAISLDFELLDDFVLIYIHIIHNH